MADFKKQAKQEYDVGYNQKVQGLKNQLAQNQQTLEQQKGGINANYNEQVSNQNLSNKKAKNNISNTMLGRGLANSSIVTSGLAESDQINNRMVGQINTGRTGALNDIEQQKSLLAQNLQGSLATMGGDREDAISTLARQLEDRQFEKDYKNKGLSLQREEMLADQKYKNLTLAQQKELSAQQLAFNREQMSSDNAYKYASLDWQKQQSASQLAWEREKYAASQQAENEPNNDAYNAYLAMYSDIKGNDDEKSVKTKKLNQLADEMAMYGQKNNVDLNDLIKKSNQRVYHGTGR